MSGGLGAEREGARDSRPQEGRTAAGRRGGEQLTFSTFLQLERAARHAQSEEALRFVLVNETRRLLAYRQAVLAIRSGAGALRVAAVSGVAVLDRNAPFLRWVEAAMSAQLGDEAANEVRQLDSGALPERLQGEWQEWAAPAVLWCPLLNSEGETIGALWLARDEAWTDSERVLAGQLCDAYAHAWTALTGGRRRAARPRRGRWIALALAAALGGALLLPVRQSALAPAEVVGAEPELVAAPIDGVIADFAVAPNQEVAAGDVLFRFDDTNLRSQRDVARRTLEVARADLKRAVQGAFSDRESKAQVALLEAQVGLREAELAHAEALLERVVVSAGQAGIAVFADADDWIGRPVQTGERIMQIADPAHTELRIELAVGDAIVLNPGAEVELFLDSDPLQPLPARLESASYEAEATPDGTLAYRVAARFPDGLPPPRIGLRGTAKVQGDEVPLFLYLFRRPAAVVRQTLGL